MKKSSKDKVVTFECPDYDAYNAFMKKLSAGDNLCWVASVCFGRGFTSSYPRPSKIPHTVCGDPPIGRRGYWRAGQFHPFPERLRIKYENTCISGDR